MIDETEFEGVSCGSKRSRNNMAMKDARMSIVKDLPLEESSVYTLRQKLYEIDCELEQKRSMLTHLVHVTIAYKKLIRGKFNQHDSKQRVYHLPFSIVELDLRQKIRIYGEEGEEKSVEFSL